MVLDRISSQFYSLNFQSLEKLYLNYNWKNVFLIFNFLTRTYELE